MKNVSKLFVALIFLILYAPIIVVIFFSFNDSSSLSVFNGFSLKWYASIFQNERMLSALYNTLLIAILSAVLSTIIGTAAAVGIVKLKNKRFVGGIMSVTNIPMMNPEIVTGISMMILFVFIGQIFNTKLFGIVTVLIAHITFCLPYVILSVMPKLRQMDQHLPEAALDLGCTPMQAFFKVELPAIMPGIFTGFIMAFTLSIDDFIITYFTTGTTVQTLPIYIFNMTKKPVKPDTYAITALIFITVLVLLILLNITGSKGDKNKKTENTKRRSQKN